jgi:hypothetical protein
MRFESIVQNHVAGLHFDADQNPRPLHSIQRGRAPHTHVYERGARSEVGGLLAILAFVDAYFGLRRLYGMSLTAVEWSAKPSRVVRLRKRWSLPTPGLSATLTQSGYFRFARDSGATEIPPCSSLGPCFFVLTVVNLIE